MTVRIPIRLESLANLSHLHWYRLRKIANTHKEATYYCLLNQPIPPLPLLVTITRIAPRKLDDDNLQGACKYVRDQIAAKVGVDDRSDQYTWKYKQRNDGVRVYGVEVEITGR